MQKFETFECHSSIVTLDDTRAKPMDHNEAVQQMATERYLLGDMTPDLREAFEEHFFDCPECAFDLRAGTAFVDEAKLQLPALKPSPAPKPVRQAESRWRWPSLWKPAFAAPAFALLLALIGYQNLATIPTLRSAAAQPRLQPWIMLHTETRDGAHIPVEVSRGQDAVLVIDMPDGAAWTSFAFELNDPAGRPFWRQTLAITPDASGGEMPLSLTIPREGLHDGTYTLTITGNTTQGTRTPLKRQVLDVHLDE